MIDLLQNRLSCDEFEAWITVNGEALPSYGIQYKEAEREASCWIESAEDQEFSVHFRKKTKNGKDYSAKLFLDGQQVAYFIYESAITGLDERVIDCMSISAMEVRNFVFASLDLTDDDAVLENPCHKDIGNVKVVFSEGTNASISMNPPRIFPAPNAEKVHERSKKGLGHRVNLGPAIFVPPTNKKSVIFSACGEPYTCVFNYRPLAILQAADIVPRIPNPELPKVKREVIGIESSDDDDDKEAELLGELQQVRNRKRGKHGTGSPNKRLKTEPVPREVIDLTLSD